MKRQRNMTHMKEQNKTPEKKINKTDIATQSDTKFKTLVIRMHRELVEYSKNIKEETKAKLSKMKGILF